MRLPSPAQTQNKSGDKSITYDFAVLHASWARAWRGVGARGDGAGLRDELLARYAEPHRHYHSLQHLTECLSLFERYGALAQDPAAVETALWFHDAIYATRRKDNERLSAELAAGALTEAGARTHAARVRLMVLATAHSTEELTPDEALLVDIDLAILGATPLRYDEYEAQVRAEYAHVPRWLYRRARRKLLNGFLARPRIYATPALFDAFELSARANIARALAGSLR